MPKNILMICTLGILFTACASQEERQVIHQQVDQEKVVSRDDLSASTREFISNSDKLTEKQRSSLKALQESTESDMKTLSEKINQTKMVLIKSLMEPKVDQKKVSILRRDLKKLEKEKMKKSLSSFDKAQRIITPVSDLETRERLYQSFLMREGRYY